MSMDDYDLFIFDWDGTLSTSTFIVRVSNLLRVRYLPKHMQKHKEDYMRNAARNLKIKEEKNKMYAYLYDLYSALFAPRLKTGAIELIKTLRKKGKKIAIFSDSQAYRLLLEVRKLGVLDYFDFVLSASSIGYYKPNPSGIMLISDRYKALGKKTIYIGDMPADIMTAKFAGVVSCGLGDGLGTYVSLKEAGPDYLFKDIQALLKEIGR
jgi:phosphoglycolate phosphatase